MGAVEGASGAISSRIWGRPPGHAGRGGVCGRGGLRGVQAPGHRVLLGGPGLLVHPVWQTANAYFVELSLRMEPRPTMCATPLSSGRTGLRPRTDGGACGQLRPDGEWFLRRFRWGDRYYTVKKGDTLWGIAKQYGVALTALIAANPQIKNPNLIYPGDRVRMP